MAAGTNRWLHIDLEGVTTNRTAVGARVEVVSSAGRQVRWVRGGEAQSSQHSLTVELGLGEDDLVDTLRVFWPRTGEWDTTAVAANQRLTLVEPPPPVSMPPNEILTLAFHPPHPNPVLGGRSVTSLRFDLPEASVTLTVLR